MAILGMGGAGKAYGTLPVLGLRPLEIIFNRYINLLVRVVCNSIVYQALPFHPSTVYTCNCYRKVFFLYLMCAKWSRISVCKSEKNVTTSGITSVWKAPLAVAGPR